MKIINIGLVGFGNVGHGLAAALAEKNNFFRSAYNMEFRITAISDLRYGAVYQPAGLPLEILTEAKDFSSIPGTEHPDWNAIEMIRNAETDAIVELSFTDLKTGEPALQHCKEAICSGKHVVTSNKGPVALHYTYLKGLAAEYGVKIGIEGTVMSGTPALRLGMEVLKPTGIREVKGILNGTTNFILTEMEKGSSYLEALEKAQQLGYAEADPTGDVEGYDAAGKVAILAQMLFDADIKPMDVDRSGITDISEADVAEAGAQGMRWKLIGCVRKHEEGLETFVRPMMLPLDNPLAGVSGATNAIQYQSDLLGLVTLIGAGAGRKETAAAIIEDLTNIFR